MQKIYEIAFLRKSGYFGVRKVGMLKKDRKSYILRLLSEQSAVTVSALSEAFHLSEVSVRKLLESMEQEGTIRRTWGGAVSAMGSTGDPPYEEKMVRHLAEKRAIAKAAYALITDGDAVYLDSGTTTLQLAQMIATGPKRNVMVCTNAINIAMSFRAAEEIEVHLIGGHFNARTLSCSGGMAREALKSLFFDKGFLSGSHFSLERGLTTPNMQEAEVKRTVLSAAKEVFLLADFSKYGNDSLAQIAPAGKMGTLITDWRAPEEIKDDFEELGVRVVRASDDSSNKDERALHIII